MTTRSIFCCACDKDVDAELIDGLAVYPHRRDLYDLPFWRCPTCSNFVGCHHKTKNRTKPLGVIASPEIKAARQHIHRILDPLWKQNLISRGDVYRRLSETLGRQYHTSDLRTLEECRAIYRAIQGVERAETWDRRTRRSARS